MRQRYETRNWSATDIGFLQENGEANEIMVSGEVQTLNTGEHPKLKEAPHHYGALSTLVLELEVPSPSDRVGAVVEWRPISFSKRMPGAPKFHEVEIRGPVSRDVMIPVRAFAG